MTTRFAAEQLAKKLRLEATVRPELNRFFRSVSRLITPVWVASGQAPDLQPFSADLTALLRKHYTRTKRAFIGDTTKSLQRSIGKKQDTVPSVLLETEAELITHINDTAPAQAERILETTQNEFDAIIAAVLVGIAASGKEATPKEEARRITQDFNSRIPSRADTIAAFETQSMAEATKKLEANAIAATGATIAGVAISQLMVKEWHTILDDKTRESHVIADGQVRNQGEPFTVGGESLQVPSDSSLGASLKNIINCRCAVSFGLRG